MRVSSKPLARWTLRVRRGSGNPPAVAIFSGSQVPVTRLRTMMLEELQRRNYSQSTVRAYVRAVHPLAAHFHQPSR
jgi:hypothetical protein